MCAVVRLAKGGTLAWLSRFHSQAREDKVGVGRGGEVPGGRRENRGWGLGVFTAQAAPQENLKHSTMTLSICFTWTPPFSLSATPWKLLALSCHRWAGSKARQPQRTDWMWKTKKKKKFELWTHCKSMHMQSVKIIITYRCVQGNAITATTSWHLKVYSNS